MDGDGMGGAAAGAGPGAGPMARRINDTPLRVALENRRGRALSLIHI